MYKKEPFTQVYKSLFHCCSLKLLVCTLMLCQLINTGCVRCPSVLVSASCKFGDAHWWVESHNASSLKDCFRITLQALLPPIQGEGTQDTLGAEVEVWPEPQHKWGKTLFSGFLDCRVLLLPSSMIREAFPSLAPIVLYMKETEIKRYDICSCEHVCVCP